MERYSEQDILAGVGRKAFEAALEYAREGRVLALEEDGKIVFGQVRGTARRPYEQTIEIGEGVRRGFSIAGECTCSVGFNCKHVAAVLLHGLRSTQSFADPSSEQRVARLLTAPVQRSATSPNQSVIPMPGLAAWLDELDRAQATAEESYPASIAQRLVYVLSPIPFGQGVPRLGLRPISARLLKDGRFSGNSRPYDPSSALSGLPAKFLRPSDLRILRAATLLRRDYGSYGGYGSGGVSLACDGGAAILADVLTTGRARWLGLDGPALAAGPPRSGRIVWQPAGEAALAPQLELDGGAIALAATPPVYVDPEQGLVGTVETGHPPRIAATLLAAPAVPGAAVAAFNAALAQRAPHLAALAAPEPRRERLAGVLPIPVLSLFAADLPPERASPYSYYGYGAPPVPERVGLGRLSFRYGPVTIPLGEAHPVVMRLVAGRLIELHRDGDAERRAVAHLLANDFVPLPERRARVPDAHARDFVPEGDDLAWLDAQFHTLPQLHAEGWEIEVSDDFPGRLVRAGERFEAEVREGSGIDWLELHLGVMVDGERIDLIGPIVAMIAAPGFDLAMVDTAEDDEAAYLPLRDGRILAFPAARLKPIVAAIRELALGNGAGEGCLRLSRADAAGLADFEATIPDTIWRGGERVREMGRRLGAAGGIPSVVLPPDFRATLRPYQQEGVSWLAFLGEVGFGGVLADDMGLGKTVQALALLAIEKAQGRLDGPALVVAPTSLMANWRREAERFAPDLRVLTLHGHDRADRFGAIPDSDLVLTTYPLIARDHAVLAARTWPLLLLDEAQTIKNPDAATTKLLLGIEARHRLCLTGTPLENNLDELWSLFAFACPGLLGDRRSFARVWRNPIEKHGDRERSRLLARRVRPFLLRRTKEEVARELPPKTEIVERIDLQGPQRDVYEAIRLSMHARVSAAIAERGWARSRIIILDALLKLRQACCDPRLLKQASADDKALPPKRNAACKPATRLAGAGSAKLDRLEEMLVELLAEERRILVFSQFTSMLRLIEERLTKRAIRYALLTGATRDREAAIRLFEGGSVSIFLVSLKAGGTGLNLIAADTVILYDPWWNPAVEDQAVDRAYRIGQTKPVFVHKLVASGTIEEKMEILKERKSALAQSLFDQDGTPTLAMTQADLELLLSPELQ
ncbi:Superfamily II DNA or RNA helicase, SNF2 family [Methylobacterium sp. 275MFSha3.1]|uniref:DEAD/DEAH box helicase n=1 Tax=Methylobacterium sp. 275MFSha3.1 TaxID=1502746 RepID=UPI0008A799E4|nr:DEAD/DEAH box helicase [Methylobacterium sp. 275MFSha3.1]SEI14479.1 Superfamily II DNA or RNA helicase, SNF2 family [Methylobacterium sp. 275MFSha3.1]